MTTPRDITGSIYKSKKLRTRAPFEPEVKPVAPRIRMRRMAFSSFTVAVGLALVIALFSQVLLMSLFNWL